MVVGHVGLDEPLFREHRENHWSNLIQLAGNLLPTCCGIWNCSYEYYQTNCSQSINRKRDNQENFI